MKNTSKELQLPKSVRKKQGGFQSFESLLNYGAVAAIVLGIVAFFPTIMYKLDLMWLQGEVVTVADAAKEKKKRASNYELITYAGLCSDKYLDDSYCGTNPGKSVNSFGGDLDFQADPSNPGLRNVIVTIPTDTDRITDIADTLANGSRNRCVSSTGCDTISVSGNKIIVTL